VTFDSLQQMLAPVGAFAIVNFIESNFASPWIVGRRLEISPLVVFVSVMICGWIWGVAGAFIAVPLLVAIRAAARRSKRLRLWTVYLDHSREPKSLRFLLGLRRRRRKPAPEAALGTPKLDSDAPPVPRDV
jgi:predicted PurR-regulated permease PerM